MGKPGLDYFASSAAAITGPILTGSQIELIGENYVILWLFSAVFIAIAAGLMLRVRSQKSTTSA
jgi:hypothetical protein